MWCRVDRPCSLSCPDHGDSSQPLASWRYHVAGDWITNPQRRTTSLPERSWQRPRIQSRSVARTWKWTWKGQRPHWSAQRRQRRCRHSWQRCQHPWQRQASGTCLAVTGGPAGPTPRAAQSCDCPRWCCTRSCSSSSDHHPPQQLGWASTRSPRGPATGHHPRPEGQWTHAAFCGHTLDQGPNQIAGGNPGTPDPSQCLACLCHRIFGQMGRLCQRVCGGRQKDAATHPSLHRRSTGRTDRVGQPPSPSSPIFGPWRQRGGDAGCNGRGLDTRSSTARQEFRADHWWLEYHGHNLAGCQRTCRHGHHRCGCERCPSTVQAQTHYEISSSNTGRNSNRAATADDHPWRRWTRWAVWTALFWRGRWVDPQEIIHQWPEPFRPELCWLHSVCSDWDFFSPWHASQHAVDLAWECGTLPSPASSSSKVSSTWFATSSSAKSVLCPGSSSPGKLARAVSFDDTIELRIGLDSWSSLVHYQQVHLNVAEVSAWSEKPWSLHVGSDVDFQTAATTPWLHSARLLGEVDNPPTSFETVAHLDGEDFHVPPLHTLGAWIQQLWPSFLSVARVHRRGWYPTAYLRTWFLDGAGGIHDWSLWREFELDPRIDLWLPRLRTLWSDQLVPDTLLDIRLVDPPVPVIPGWTSHLGDLILVQRPQPSRCALLVHTTVRFPREDRLGLLALLAPLRQARHDLLRCVRLTFQTWRHPCTIHRGPRMLLDGLLDHTPFSGLTIAVDMGPDLSVPAETPGADALSLMQTPRGALAPHENTPWESAIFDLWVTSGATACDEIGPELFVQTWYVHHDDHRICFEARTWVATAPRATWEDQLRELWDDMMEPGAPLSIHFIDTDAPISRCHARLVLVQGAGAYKAVLLSALYHDHPGHQLVQAAFSSPSRVDGHYLQRLLGAVGACQLVHCELMHGGQRLELDAPLLLWNGWAAELHVPFEPPPSDDFSLMAMGLDLRPANPPIMENPSIVQLDDLDDEDVADDASSDSASPWKLSAVFSTQLEPVYGHTDWTTYEDLKTSTIDLFSPDAADLVAVHHVPHPPWDLADDDTAVFIGELPEDQDDSGIVNALVLLDVGFFRNRPDDVGDVSIRLAKALPPLLTREGLLDITGVHPYCAALQLPPPGPGCLVWRNHLLLQTQDEGPLHFVHGDYVRIAIPPSPVLPPDLSVRHAAGLCLRGLSLEAIAARADAATLSNDSAEDLVPLGDPLPLPELDDTTDFMQLPASSLTRVGPDLVTGSAVARGDCGSWFDTLHSLWRDAHHGTGSVDHAQALPLALTWYLDHDRAPLTSQSRVLALRPTPGTWKDDLVRLWSDWVDPWVACEVVVVRPPPFAAPSEHLVRLILVQRARPALVSTLVALVDDAVDPWTSDILALAAPIRLSQQVLLHQLHLVPPCPPLGLAWQCETYGPDGHLFGANQEVALHDGASLMISIYRLAPSAPPLADPPDYLGLLQLGAQRVRTLLDKMIETPSSSASVPVPIALAEHLDSPPVVQHTVNCAQAFKSFFKLQELFLVPSFDVAELDGWHPSSPWTCSWWDGCSPFDAIAIYFDGAFLPSAGLGVAAFVAVGGEWLFAGFVSATLPLGSDSYQAEQVAGATAAKLAFDLLSVRSATSSAPVRVGIYYDSITVGMQAQGRWATKRHLRVGRVLRSLVRLCQALYPCSFHFEHVRGHTGEPGNELADYLASAAANQWDPFCMDLTHWFDLLRDSDFVGGLEWTWTLFHRDFVSLWHGDQLHLPAAQWAPLDPACVKCPFPTSSTSSTTWTLRLVSYNALTAAGAVERSSSASSPARLEMLAQQFAGLDVHIFALQETRIRHVLPSELEHYYIFQSLADSRGHFGVVIGLAKTFALDAGQQHRFTPSAVKIIYQSPRALILGLTLPGLRCLLFGLHAPHSGESATTLHDWWSTIAKAVPARYKDWPTIVLTDANAVVGAHPSHHIGDHQAGPLEPKAEAFVDFVTAMNLFLPSTFDSWQCGVGDTWTHSSGQARRIDYVALPLEWTYSQGAAWVLDDFETGHDHHDHLPVFVEASFDLCDPGAFVYRPPKQFARDAYEGVDPSAFASLPSIPWEMDVHNHAALLHSSTEQALRRQLRRQPATPKPRKSTLSGDTWTLVLQKRAVRRSLYALNAFQRWLLLRTCFDAFRGGSNLAPRDGFATQMSILDWAIAQTLWAFRALGRQVTSALRADDRRFFSDLVSEGAELLAPHQVRRFWHVIRRSLPKMRGRRQVAPPFRQACLETQWDDYFCDLEVGELVPVGQLVSDCVSRQAQHPHCSQVVATELPSINDWEDAVRETTPQRSTGWDSLPSGLYHGCAPELADHSFGLFLKILLHGCEPIQYKGGPMALIHKGGKLDVISNYRGILLLPSLSKRIHAVLRRKAMEWIAPQRLDGQIGGFAHQHVCFGSQMTRTAALLFDKAGYSNFTLFVDLRQAFHRLTRELVTGTAVLADFEAVDQALQSSTGSLGPRARHLAHVGILTEYGCPEYLLRVLRDLHCDSWCSLADGHLIRTRRGTRPGSPLADLIFHAVMQSIAGDFTRWAAEQADFVEILDHLGLALPLVIWSDDLAVTWAATSGADLLLALDRLMIYLHNLFQEYGFELNYSPGKTNAVVTFHGPQGPALRREWLLHPQAGRFIHVRPDVEIFLPFVVKYRHLGTLFTSAHSLDLEIGARIGQAAATFKKISKTIVCNKYLPLDTRLRLFHALVSSRLFFGLGAWPTPSSRLLQRLDKTYVGFLRRVLRLPADGGHLTNGQVLVRCQSVGVRCRLALDRLLYARKVFQVGPHMLQHLLNLEFSFSSSSWLHGLREDLRWMNFVRPGLLPSTFEETFTEVVDWWQDPDLPWKRYVQQARRRHLLQETMMQDIHDLHRQIFKTVRSNGATLNPDPQSLDLAEEAFDCPNCRRSFSTHQGLAAHRRLAHGVHAPEHAFVVGATCPACLRFLWTSNRLAMHLAYAPRDGRGNPCYNRLLEMGFVADHHFQDFPSFVMGASRKEALQTYGPLPQISTRQDRALRRAFEEQEQCLAELQDLQIPPNEEIAYDELVTALNSVVAEWFADVPSLADDALETNLTDRIWALFADFPSSWHAWVCDVFYDWGTHALPDLAMDFVDGRAEPAVDNAFKSIVDELPRVQCLLRLERTKHRIRRLQHDGLAPLAPHRPPKLGTSPAATRKANMQAVPSLFRDHGSWHAELRRVHWGDLPQDPKVPCVHRAPPEVPLFVCVHLFAGRRRPGDFHDHVLGWADRLNIKVLILSMDTAIDKDLGNLSLRSCSWEALVRLYEGGLVMATLTGSPCETWTEARFVPPPPGVAPEHWPRPLRSVERVYGLADLSNAELKQCWFGSAFYLQAMYAATSHLLRGGYFIGEHPAKPVDASHPSTWTTAVVEFIRRHPNSFLHHVEQYRYGACSVKPTGLLAVNLPRFKPVMNSYADWNAPRPTAVSIGVDEQGHFKTAKLKEYPVQFSAAMAAAIMTQLRQDRLDHRVQAVEVDATASQAWSWASHMAQVCSVIRAEAQWLPDYQRDLLWASLPTFSLIRERCNPSSKGSDPLAAMKWNEMKFLWLAVFAGILFGYHIERPRLPRFRFADVFCSTISISCGKLRFFCLKKSWFMVKPSVFVCSMILTNQFSPKSLTSCS